MNLHRLNRPLEAMRGYVTWQVQFLLLHISACMDLTVHVTSKISKTGAFPKFWAYRLQLECQSHLTTVHRCVV